MKKIILLLMLSLALGNLYSDAGNAPQKKSHKKTATAKKTSKVYTYNLGNWKNPNYIAVTEGLTIKESLIKNNAGRVTEITSDENYDILAITSEYFPEKSYYFFSKGFKTLYAHASKNYVDERDYNDKKFENKNDKSFKQINTYQFTYRVQNGDDGGYVHYIYDRDEELYEKYFSGGSKYYYSEIAVFDCTSDCNTVKKVKTNCAIIQAMVELFYLQDKHKREREEAHKSVEDRINRLRGY